MGQYKINLRSLFGGIPFLDQEFRVADFLTAVAVARRERARRSGMALEPLENYLQPFTARAVYDSTLMRNPLNLGRTLTASEANLVSRSVALIAHEMHLFTPLITIPLDTRRSKDELIIGYSNASRPQTIFLGPLSWTSLVEMREQVLHEIAHVWLYMIEELWPLHKAGNTQTFTLPSGVRNKSATGVLNAAFVAAVLAKFYRSMGVAWIVRSRDLTVYLEGCLNCMSGFNELTHIGREVRVRLGESLNEIRTAE